MLGQSAAFTGPASELGEQFKRGALLYFDRVNTRGGIGGRPIELVSLDDGYEPDRCAANTKKLIERGVFALFGYIGTPTSLAALPLATAAKTPFIAPFTGAEALRAPFNRYAFHVRASYFDETAAIVKQITSVGIQRVGVFHQNDSYGKAGLEGVVRALKPLKLEPAALGTVERNTVAVDAAVTTILATNPGAIVMISAYKSCAAFIRAARKAGFGGNFYNVSFVGTQALAQELGADARGVVVSQVMPYPFAPNTGSRATTWRPARPPRATSSPAQLQQHRRLCGCARADRSAAPARRHRLGRCLDHRTGEPARPEPGRLLRGLRAPEAHRLALRGPDHPDR